MNYRKLWENNFGEIPVDEKGRPYEIHHINGDNKNNSLENLKCVSIKEHFDIHYEQKDYSASIIIANRLGLSDIQLKELRLVGVPKPKVECPHCSKVGGLPQMKQWHFDNCPTSTNGKKIERYRELFECSKCKKKIGGKSNLIQHERSCGKIKKNLKKTNDSLICPHCLFVGKPHSNMKRYHFDNCVVLTNEKRTLSDEHKKNLKKTKKRK
jgi:hypothetical protein